MKTVKLGSSDLQVSQICLGSMNWGAQNTQQDAFEQIDYALGKGINFIDTAEIYSVPPVAERYGATETIIGNWLNANPGRRQDIVLASKIVGVGVPWIRDGAPITGAAVREAIEGSLTRLQTDYIDLYQLHWPNRPGPHFGKHWPRRLPYQKMNAAKERDSFLDILRALDDCVKAGKIRYCGLSDDTPWGVKEYLTLAKEHDLPRMVSVQNEFNLLHLVDSPHVLETCIMDDVAYMPWSPLAGGALSGKYRNGERPANCRWTLNQRNGIFRDTSDSNEAIDAYYEVAQRHNLSLAQMCLAWVMQMQGVTSIIIGATSMRQLEENIGAHELNLSEEVLAEIDKVIRRYPVPF